MNAYNNFIIYSSIFIYRVIDLTSSEVQQYVAAKDDGF